MLGHVTDASASHGLALRELPAPEPSEHDVVIGVRAYGVNRGELQLLQDRANGWAPGSSELFATPPTTSSPCDGYFY